jgi:YD repeat-containing protein
MPADMNAAKAAPRGRMARALVGLTLVLGFALALVATDAMADVQYVYDEIGRLVQVVDQNGESARYVYDAAGNITQIVRIPAGTLAITSFTPKSGPVGTAVTIYGSGFSTTLANNAVQFNGTSATVTTATANQIVATVPAGAATGPIAVTVGTQTATSAESFAVTSGSGGAPTITGFTPGGGGPGTAVTIAGTNFDPVLTNNVVRFNDTQAALSSATPTEILATVPNYAGSGPISVRTPHGIGQSSNDFIVPPPGYAYADIIARSRVMIGGPSGSLAIATASKHGIVLFDAQAGDFLSLQISSLSVSPSGSVAYKVFDPKNFQIASGSVSTTAMSIHLPALTAAGTYSILFSPGAATANLTFALTRNPVLSAAQPTANATISVAGQSFRMVFAGTSGAVTTLRMGVASTSPANQSVSLTLYKDALQIGTASGSPTSDGAVIPGVTLPITGNYFVVLAPSNAATGSLSLTLNPSMDLSIDGASLNVSTTIAGYQKRLLFSGTAGQGIGIGLTALTNSPSTGSGTSVNVYKPDGTLLGTTSSTCNPANPNGSCSNPLAPLNLPSTGVYQITIAPPANVTFTGTLTASSQVYGVLNAGTALPFNITRAGQNAGFNFTGTAGQPATLRLAIASTTPANQTVTLTLWGPTGQIGSAVTGSPGSDGLTFYTASLPTSGVYGVVVVPQYAATGSMSLTLNPSMDLSIDGASLNVSTTIAGYQKRLLFSATAGQQIGLALTGLTYSPSSASGTTMTVYKPDGNTLASTPWCNVSNPNGGCTEGILNLPTTGTYQVVISPPSNVTFNGTVTASNPIYGSLTSGTPLAINVTRAGQFANVGFSGTAGQPATLRLAIASTTPANLVVTMTLWGPNGQVASAVTGTQSSDGMVFYVANLPATSRATARRGL